MRTRGFSRREFIRGGLAFGAAGSVGFSRLFAAESSEKSQPMPRSRLSEAKVAIVPCKTYGPELGPALNQCFSLLGGIGPLVKDKTVTVKLNLTGTDFRQFLERPVGETFMTHPATATALASALFK